jgi:hypothetical protein
MNPTIEALPKLLVRSL